MTRATLRTGLFFVAAGASAAAAAPPTGWVQQTAAARWSPRDSMGELVYKNEIWLFGGFAPQRVNEVWHSPDGVNWTRATPSAPWSARNLPATLVYDNKMWLIGGFNGSTGLNDVWSSTDGANWTRATASAPWAPRAASGAVVFDNRMWIYGGMGALDGTQHYNDVWSSTDGINWTRATPSAGWGPRAMLSSVVHDGKMWAIGGGIYNQSFPYNAQANYGDVWSSPDGVNWTRATEQAEWHDRRFHGSVEYDGRMWMVAGYSTGADPLGNRKDVWYSTDGAHWSQLTPVVPWPVRHEQSTLVFDGALWVIGGFGDQLHNDVWSYVPATPEWKSNRSDDWHSGQNWIGGIAPDWRGATAVLGSAVTTPQTIYANRAITLGALRFDAVAACSIAGTGSLTIDVAASDAGHIDVLRGTPQINLPLRFADDSQVNVAAGAALTLSDPVTLAGGVTVTKGGPGTLVLRSTINAPSAATLSVNTGAVDLSAVNSDPDVKIILAAGAAAVVDYPDAGPSPAGDLVRAVAAGRVATSAPLVVGLAEARDLGITSIAGRALDSTALLARPVQPGDADLNGTVDVLDLGRLAAHWQAAAIWSGGDFNHDGIVDVIDLGILASHWQGPGPLDASLAAVGLPARIVPEPAGPVTGAVAVAVVAWGGSSRCRRGGD